MFDRNGAALALAFAAGVAVTAIATILLRRRQPRRADFSGEQFEHLYFAEPRKLADSSVSGG